MIPYGKHDINQNDVYAVIGVLQSDFLTQGEQVPLFEKTVSMYCEVKYGVAVNSATSALHIACLALGLRKKDYLWTSTNSFVASANCGLYCDAKIDFVDIDPKTYNLSVIELERKLIQAKQENKLPKILIPVHFAGQSCDMKKILSLSREYGFKIIEDASHAIGGKYLEKSIGGCQYSDITVFSFHPVKIITTAEGGLATTNSKKIAEKMRLFRSHGITHDKSLMTRDPDGDWYYQQVGLGFNYRMTELQAALGISQMKRLDEFVAKRHILKERYDLLLSDLPIIEPYQDKDNYSALHLYPIQIDLNKVSKNREQIFNVLRENGVGVNVHYIPIHTQPYYLQFGFSEGDFPNSESYYNRTISIPLFHTMTAEQQDEVLDVLKRALQ
jgi:UDP-4-amino-4,6-dideoxy-N-acetyl-beta-L-altrosamine transaminase